MDIIIGDDASCRAGCAWFDAKRWRADLDEGKTPDPRVYCKASNVILHRNGTCAIRRHKHDLANQAIDLGEIARVRDEMDLEENTEKEVEK